MGCWKTKAQSQFDSWSGSYDRSVLQRLFFRPSHDLILENINVSRGSRVLDVGCGTGLFARRIAMEYPGVDVVGLDLSPGMLRIAQENCKDVGDSVQFVEGDSEHLPFDDDTFDVITCVHSFHHYPHKQNVLAEMQRVLRPGGRACIVDGNRDGWWGYLVFDWVVTTIEGLVHHCSGREFHRLYTEAGFDEVQQYGGGHLAPFLLTVGTAKVNGKFRGQSVLAEAA